jgi:hypothetical protein
MNIKYALSVLLFFLLSVVSFSQNFYIDSTFTQADTVNSVSVDYTSVPGQLQLGTGERENLARNRFAYIVYNHRPPEDTAQRNPLRLLDGSFVSPSYISIPLSSQGLLDNNGTYVMIDLQAVRVIKRVIVYTFAQNPNLRPRALSVAVGVDSTALETVWEVFENDSLRPRADFNPTTARYVKVTIGRISPGFATIISEIEVYGEGFLPQGTYVSGVKDIGKRVNFSKFQFEGNLPQGTSAAFSFRSGPSPIVDSAWGNWSTYNQVNNSHFVVDEPRQYLQYRVQLNTSNLLTPSINKIRINYDSLNVASITNSSISPQVAPVLKENDFSLRINLGFEPNDRGVDTIIITTPSPIKLSAVLLNGSPASYLSRVTANEAILVFGQTIRSSSVVDIQFATTPFLGISPFRVFVSSKDVEDNPQKVDTDRINNVEGWSIITEGVPERLIISAEASPNPFSPNGDGINDQTEISFFLGNVAEPTNIVGQQIRNLRIKIYDLTGKLIKNVLEVKSGAYAYISTNAISWDGKDENGKVVRPGVYIYQITIESDNGGEQVSKTIVVSY